MASVTGRLWLPLVLLAGGCLPGTGGTTLVPTSPFPAGQMPNLPATLTASPELENEGKRVALLGQQLLDANPKLSVKPRFLLIGAPSAEVFHRGGDDVVISEGLLRKCKNDGQLAAVLALELGKVVSEQEAAKKFRSPLPDRGPPPDVPVGNDYHGPFGPDDGTRAQELGRYEQERQQRRALDVPPPEALARAYLRKAGFADADLAEATPLLRAARDNVTLEKQLAGPRPAVPNW
jgi:hypothetical protein